VPVAISCVMIAAGFRLLTAPERRRIG